MVKSKVYFTKVKETEDIKSICEKLIRLIDKSQLFNFIKKDNRVVIKLHFGEEGNTGFVPPDYLAVISVKVVQRKANPFLADTNTLYRGRRTNSSDHLQLAYEHGFTPDKVKAEIIIPDDTQKENVKEIKINGKFIKIAKISKIFWTADFLISVAHFKGHLMTGFGGTLKNLGMGCAVRSGKLSQHSDLAPVVKAENCLGCRNCISVCPAEAISIFNNKSKIDNSKCIGCASCIAVCKSNAIDVNWDEGSHVLQEKMVEYAKAVLSNKKNKTIFFNFAVKITQECDCMAKDDPRIAPDTGIFLATDPVAIDNATLNVINETAGRDVFKLAHPNIDGLRQLNYAYKIGLGNLKYQLIEI